MQRLALSALLCAFLFYSAVSAHPGATKDTWTQVQSKNFLFIGNAGEKEIRKVALKFEQFRDVFARLFPNSKLKSSVPMRVLVFKSKNAYRPFMPVYQTATGENKISEVAGYFQPGPDVNYITLTVETSGDSSYRVIFHEYVHALTSDNTRPLPAWFSEGLAEFYSGFDISDGDKKITLGAPIANHVFFLREQKFLPLRQLFAVDHGSPDYNERDKKGVFYAQSWALVHYLMLGNDAQRRPQLIKFLGLLNAGKPVGESFETAFQTDYATMEKELRQYIGRNSYPVQQFTSEQKLEFDAALQAALLPEAEVQYYLGDLLVHTHRAAQQNAEEYLKRAIELDPNLALAQASLGVLKMRQNQPAEAKSYLEKAVALGSNNHFVHYYYAYALSREGMNENNFASTFAPEAAAKMREHLQRAIKLAPEFAESYRLLAFVNLVTGEQLDESVAMLRQAMAAAPGREDLRFMQAQLYLRLQIPDAARQTIKPLAEGSADPQMRAQAQALLERIDAYAAQMAEFKARKQAFEKAQAEQSNQERPSDQPDLTDVRETATKRPILQRKTFEGDKAKGLLTRVDCTEKTMTLTVKVGNQEMKFHSTTPDRVKFVSYVSGQVGQLTCGPINPAVGVILTYRASTDARSKFAGEPIAVEFVGEQK